MSGLDSAGDPVEVGKNYTVGTGRKHWYCFDTKRAAGVDLKTSTGSRWSYRTVPHEETNTLHPDKRRV